MPDQERPVNVLNLVMLFRKAPPRAKQKFARWVGLDSSWPLGRLCWIWLAEKHLHSLRLDPAADEATAQARWEALVDKFHDLILATSGPDLSPLLPGIREADPVF